MKPLIPNQKNSNTTPGSAHRWNVLQNAGELPESLSTPSLDGSDGIRLSHLISGIPTPFARAEIFKYAFRYAYVNSLNTNTASGKIYFELLNEWKGFLAYLVLENSDIEVISVKLDPDVKNAKNIFSPTVALGAMLFENKFFWTDPTNTTTSVPTIQLILTRNTSTVIGGVSPYTLLFTAPEYDIDTNVGYYDKKNAHFVNPDNYLNENQLNKLYAYLRDLNDKLPHYFQAFEDAQKGSKVQLENNKVEDFIENWMSSLREKAKAKGFKLNQNAIADPVRLFNLKPYTNLLNAHTDIYGYKGKFYTKEYLTDKKGVPSTMLGNKAIKIEVDELLLKERSDDSPTVVMIPEKLLGSNPNVQCLKARGDDKKDYFFALPFTHQGLLQFQEELENLLKPGGDNELRAHYATTESRLHISLEVTVNDGEDTIVSERKYKILTEKDRDFFSLPEGEKVVVWPNFVSDHWNKYYVYSELMHNRTEDFAIKPILGEYQNKRIRLLTNSKNEPVYVSDYSGSKLVVSSHYDLVGKTELQYEIFESSNPVHSLEIHCTKGVGHAVGYLFLKVDENQAISYINGAPKKDATIGFDFGSNNMCISFALAAGNAELLNIKNRRVPLLGREGAVEDLATPDRLFFFPIRERKNGQFRSYVLVHDKDRIVDDGDKNRAVTGGIPVLERNIPIEKFGTSARPSLEVKTKNEITLIHHQLKWSQERSDNYKKEALVRSIWLLLSAELYATHNARPIELNWAYPAAMASTLVVSFRTLWNRVAQQSCFTDGKTAKAGPGMTESEAVCRFALTKGGKSTAENILFIGFDVGGSTTDILVLGKKKIKDSYENVLLRQSSVLASAKYLIEAAGQKPKTQTGSRGSNFRKGIKDFISEHNIELNNVNGINAESSHYFLNLLFDELEADQLQALYGALYDQHFYDVFTAASYISGLLLFYGGMLTAEVLQKEEHQSVNNIQMGYYGKGGRIFSWLKILKIKGGEDIQFLEASFKSGLKVAPPNVDSEEWNKRIEKITISPGEGYHSYNKAEVAMGLAEKTISVHETKTEVHEIVGEKGFVLEKDGESKELHPQDLIEPETIAEFNGRFRAPQQFEILDQYVNLFIDFANKFDLIDNERFKINRDKMQENLISFVNNNNVYRAAVDNAKQGKHFDFKQPMFILAGLALFERAVLED